MKILDVYIGKIIASTTAITLSVFVSLSGIIKFVEQMKAVGRGNYDISHAALYVLYAIPRDIEIFFPMSTLIGGLIGIGMLASNSELVVMQASGGEAAAREIRAQAISGGSLVSSKNGVWAKDGDYFVHIGEIKEHGELSNIQIYKFNEQLKLSSWIAAESAHYKTENWELTGVVETFVTDENITSETLAVKPWRSSLTPDKLGVITPESLSISGLSDYLQYLEDNEQDTSRYQLAFWRKIVQPITVAVMLLVALSFIFGPLRSVSMGARIMMGVATGILFYISNEVMGSMSLVYQLPPLFGAVMPSIIFVSVALYLMQRKPS